MANAVGRCRDVDECETDSHSCSNDSVCVNGQGTYHCSEIVTETSPITSFTESSSTSKTTQVYTLPRDQITSTTTFSPTNTTAEKMNSTVLVLSKYKGQWKPGKDLK